MFVTRTGKGLLSARALRPGLSTLLNSPVNNNVLRVSCCCVRLNQRRGFKKGAFGSLFRENDDDDSTAPEVSVPTENVSKDTTMKILTQFIRKKEVLALAEERGLNGSQVRVAFNSFRKFCMETEKLPMGIHILFHDLAHGRGHPDDLFPYFMSHALNMYPHLGCKEELKRISDLRNPASWYPMARSIPRKIIYHAGPTNSGKTYHALERFMEAERSVYCGPLKMLASEVYRKAVHRGIECDLITGEERLYFHADDEPSKRVACTVEMTSLNTVFDVAVIDEIQMVQDAQRGWAWTRALLGVAAEEVHLCGEAAAIPLVKSLLESAGEFVEVREHKRLTPLTIEEKPLRSLKSVEPGDCLVCFSKKDIFLVARELERIGVEVSVIYGSLPPGAKFAQATKFNDPDNSCSVMVATDAIGMGLNLNIRRIIFYSLQKIEVDKNGKKKMESISVSQALQIAGRAGRYGSKYSEGYVTAYKPRDLPILKMLLSSLPPPVAKAGLHPTAEQIEMFSYHLPESTLQSLLEVFTELCQMDDSQYFLCNIETFKFLADLISDIPLRLHSRYLFCCAPVNIKVNYIVVMFSKITRRYSQNLPITAEWLAKEIKWPLNEPKNLVDLVTMEYIHDVFDIYLWLSFRFKDIFVDADEVRTMQKDLDLKILHGVAALSRFTLDVKQSDSNDSQINEGSDSNGSQINEGSDSNDSQINEASVSKQLIQRGTITQQDLERLKKEWMQEFSEPKSNGR